MFKSLLAAAVAIVLSVAPVSAAEKPPLSHGVTNYYTTAQQHEPQFLACLAGRGYDHPLTADERRMLRPSLRQRYQAAFWSCFSSVLEPHPARTEVDSFCSIDGRLHPMEDCAPDR